MGPGHTDDAFSVSRGASLHEKAGLPAGFSLSSVCIGTA